MAGPPAALLGRRELGSLAAALIYFKPPVHYLLPGKLAAALGGGGVLMLGRSEQLLQPGQLGLAQVAPPAYRREAA